LADKHTQANIFAFRAGHIFQMTEPHLDFRRGIADIDSVSRVSACLHGLGNKILRAIKRVLWCQHDSRLGAGRYSVNQAAFKKP
jgi:hypothetical protein